MKILTLISNPNIEALKYIYIYIYLSEYRLETLNSIIISRYISAYERISDLRTTHN